MIGEFVADYIKESITLGLTNLVDIRAKAEDEIDKINTSISEIELLKDKATKLRAVIKHLGGTGYKNETNELVDFSVPEDKLTVEFKNICIGICDLIDSCEPISVGAVLAKYGIKNNVSVYSAIKWLGERNIITRDIDRNLLKGNNWDRRIENN